MNNVSYNNLAKSGGKSPRSTRSGRSKSRSRSRRTNAGGNDGLEGIIEERSPSP